jgi:hypothetical protein
MMTVQLPLIRLWGYGWSKYTQNPKEEEMSKYKYAYQYCLPDGSYVFYCDPESVAINKYKRARDLLYLDRQNHRVEGRHLLIEGIVCELERQMRQAIEDEKERVRIEDEKERELEEKRELEENAVVTKAQTQKEGLT